MIAAMLRPLSVFVLGACVLISGVLPQDNVSSSLRTRAEDTNYEETTRYDEVMHFLKAATKASDKLHLTSFGYTTEGRKLPLVVFGDVRDASAGAVLEPEKTRVYVQANIHAGEVCGKEALLVLLRDLALGKHADWAESLILLIAPIYNADGNERVNLNNRPRQHGPLGGMGQRPNAQGYDLNRDHMKLDSPEARSLVRLFNRYDPHLVVDLHTTNGTRHAYHLTYSPPLNPNTDPTIDTFLRQEWLPAVTEAVRKKRGWDFYYYGNLPWRGMNVERGWYTFDHRPRFNNNYVGLRNRFAILSEAYAYATFEERIQATLYFVEEILNFARAYSPKIREIVKRADANSVVGQRLALQARYVRSAEPVEILLGDVFEEQNPYSGKTILRRKDVSKPEKMYEYGAFEPTQTEAAPQFYFVPKELAKVADLLQAHGLRYEIRDTDRRLQVERFRIDSTKVAEKAYQGHQPHTLFGHYESVEQVIPAGTYWVPVDQPLGRLAFYLLEARSDDGLVNWGLLAESLKDADFYPILRLPAQH